MSVFNPRFVVAALTASLFVFIALVYLIFALSDLVVFSRWKRGQSDDFGNSVYISRKTLGEPRVWRCGECGYQGEYSGETELLCRCDAQYEVGIDGEWLPASYIRGRAFYVHPDKPSNEMLASGTPCVICMPKHVPK